MAAKLILIRHSAVQANTEKRYTGSRSDPSLTAEGRKQAEDLAQRISRGQNVDRVLASPLARAHETAEKIAQEKTLAVDYDPRLKEIDFGRWDGKTFSEIPPADKSYITQWVEEPLTFRFPEGEAISAFLERTNAVAKDCINSPDRTICVVTHGGNVRAMICYCLGIDFSHQHAFAVPPGTVVFLETEHMPGRLISLEPPAIGS